MGRRRRDRGVGRAGTCTEGNVVEGERGRRRKDLASCSEQGCRIYVHITFGVPQLLLLPCVCVCVPSKGGGGGGVKSNLC